MKEYTGGRVFQALRAGYASIPEPTGSPEEPPLNEYQRGVVPLETLPAPFWNWFLRSISNNDPRVADVFIDLYGEFDAILTAAGRAPTNTKGDIYNALSSMWTTAINNATKGLIDNNLKVNTATGWAMITADGGYYSWNRAAGLLSYCGPGTGNVKWIIYTVNGGGENFNTGGGTRLGTRTIWATDGSGTLRQYYTTGLSTPDYTDEDELVTNEDAQEIISQLSGGLKPPVVLELESELPTTGQQVGDNYVIKDMDITQPGFTGQAWWIGGPNWEKVVSRLFMPDDETIVLNEDTKLQIAPEWLDKVNNALIRATGLNWFESREELEEHWDELRWPTLNIFRDPVEVIRLPAFGGMMRYANATYLLSAIQPRCTYDEETGCLIMPIGDTPTTATNVGPYVYDAIRRSFNPIIIRNMPSTAVLITYVQNHRRLHVFQFTSQGTTHFATGVVLAPIFEPGTGGSITANTNVLNVWHTTKYNIHLYHADYGRTDSQMVLLSWFYSSNPLSSSTYNIVRSTSNAGCPSRILITPTNIITFSYYLPGATSVLLSINRVDTQNAFVATYGSAVIYRCDGILIGTNKVLVGRINMLTNQIWEVTYSNINDTVSGTTTVKTLAGQGVWLPVIVLDSNNTRALIIDIDGGNIAYIWDTVNGAVASILNLTHGIEMSYRINYHEPQLWAHMLGNKVYMTGRNGHIAIFDIATSTFSFIDIPLVYTSNYSAYSMCYAMNYVVVGANENEQALILNIKGGETALNKSSYLSAFGQISDVESTKINERYLFIYSNMYKDVVYIYDGYEDVARLVTLPTPLYITELVAMPNINAIAIYSIYLPEGQFIIVHCDRLNSYMKTSENDPGSPLGRVHNDLL